MGDRRRPGEGSRPCGPCRSCVFPVQVASGTGRCGGRGGDGAGRLRGTSNPLRRIGSPAMPVRAHGRSDTCIARETGLRLDTVRRWRGRFAQACLPGLKDLQRCGRSSSFTPLQAAEVKSLACRLPAESEVPLSRWSCPEPAREAARRTSPRSCRRRPCIAGWPQEALTPWQHRSWIFITSPGAAATPPSPPARPGRCASITPTDAAVPWPTSTPTTSNGSSHRGQRAADRLTAVFPNTVMVHTPVHASWLNQVEIYFSAVQRKALSPNDFADLICRPGSTGTPPVTTKNPLSHRQLGQLPKDLRRRPLSSCRSWACRSAGRRRRSCRPSSSRR